jgi:hypothetical protein
MTVTVARMNNKIVEVIRVADTVAFSTERGWVCVSPHVGNMNSNAVRWYRIDEVHFDWIRDFNFVNEIA